MSLSGIIFDIQHFCTHDGPGVRTTVFLKGCPLRCVWCHNPESQSFRPEPLYHSTKCASCNACEAACPYHEAHVTLADADLRKARCADCNLCSEACLYGAIELAGRRATVSEVLNEVAKDSSYYRHSGGGLTLSGGEALAQPDFTLALLKAAKEQGIHTAIETSGYARQSDLAKLAPFVDLWLWDIKMLQPRLHKKLTGVDVEPLIENLKFLSSSDAAIGLRILFIPEFHSNNEYLSLLSELILSLKNRPRIEVIPYHQLGLSKRDKLGLSQHEGYYREPTHNETEAFEKDLRERVENKK